MREGERIGDGDDFGDDDAGAGAGILVRRQSSCRGGVSG
jgi:hypothetical protein